MLSTIFKPQPYPALVLLAVIFTIFGFNVMRLSRMVGWVLIAMAAWLLISFIRGLMVDLTINRDGLVTEARVTNVEHKSGTSKGKPEEWWLIHYTYTDNSGQSHENSIDIWDAEEASRWKAGDGAKVRYHPASPEEHRWLE